MNILDYQYFVDTQEKNKLSEDEYVSPVRPACPACNHPNAIYLQQDSQVAIRLMEEFEEFATILPNGEEIITYQDGRVELLSKNGKTTPLLPCSANRP